jgi:hypothetical protein
MLTSNRIIWKDNATLRDLSLSLNDLYTGTETIAFVAAEDAIYIGGDLPFGNRYFEVGTANTNTASVSVSIWDGNAFSAVAETLDQTSVGGKTLAQSGIISWNIDRDKQFSQEDTTEDISDLSTLKLYDLYWVKLTFSADLSASTALKYVGFKFARDEDLAGRYPDLNRSDTKTAFSASKTTWNDQHILAAEEIIRDLRKKREIISPNQILDYEVFTQPAVHKVAEIIMNSFGKDFIDQKEQARKDYQTLLNKLSFQVDANADGRLELGEKVSSARLSRG